MDDFSFRFRGKPHPNDMCEAFCRCVAVGNDVEVCYMGVAKIPHPHKAAMLARQPAVVARIEELRSQLENYSADT